MKTASKNPPDPFRPNVAHPKLGGDDAQMLTSSAPGKQLVPFGDGKREYRLPNKRQGFSGIARRGKIDQNVGISREFPRQK